MSDEVHFHLSGTNKTADFGVLRIPGNYITIDCISPLNTQFGVILKLKDLSAPIFSKMTKISQKESAHPSICRTVLEIFLSPAVEDNQQVWFQ